jgi:NAD(P)-dependent dehydrogenase (short-subunit alcohol dehydrogenase family)
MLMKAAHPHLKKSGGNIVNFGSGALLSGVRDQGSYAAAKEAIRGLTKIAATEWGPDGIRVNLVCPFALSPGVALWKQYDPAGFELGLSRIPLGRAGDCETDIGEAVVFLASDSARYITGHTLMVDGGQTKVF